MEMEMRKEWEKGAKNSGNRWIYDEPDVINMNHDEIVSCFKSNSFVCFSDFLFVHLIFMDMSFFGRTVWLDFKWKIKQFGLLCACVCLCACMLAVLISKVDRCYQVGSTFNRFNDGCMGVWYTFFSTFFTSAQSWWLMAGCALLFFNVSVWTRVPCIVCMCVYNIHCIWTCVILCMRTCTLCVWACKCICTNLKY